MEVIARTIKTTLPNYLKKLPIPNTIDGFGKLKSEQLLELSLFFIIVTIVFYAVLKLLIPKRSPKPIVNHKIKKSNPKVVDLVEIEDLAKVKEKIAYCRCWKSEKFPECDGSHNKHNECTGDNVGPLVLKHKEK